MKKLLSGMVGVAALLATTLPSHESLNHTYQSSLWTYSSHDQRLTFTKRPLEICFRYGEQRPSFELIQWERIRLGFPFRAITIDYQSNNRILQVRGELILVAINLGCGISIGFFLFCGIMPWLYRRHQNKQNKAEMATPRKPSD